MKTRLCKLLFLTTIALINPLPAQISEQINRLWRQDTQFPQSGFAVKDRLQNPVFGITAGIIPNKVIIDRYKAKAFQHLPNLGAYMSIIILNSMKDEVYKNLDYQLRCLSKEIYQQALNRLLQALMTLNWSFFQ